MELKFGYQQQTVTLNAENVYKVKKGMEREATKAIQSNGADDVMFKLQGDTYIASGRSMKMDRMFPGQKDGTLNGQPVEAIVPHPEVTSAKDGLKLSIGFSGMAIVAGPLLAGYGAYKATKPEQMDKVLPYADKVSALPGTK